MRNGKDINSCLFGEELVAYIYGELNPADRSAFEKHLLDCSGCTAEFADISLSRLGVYEWHRDEFVPLATPHFEIPYQVPASAPSTFSWIEGLRNFVSPMRIAFAGGSLAALVFTVIVLNGWNSNEDDVAAATVPAVKVNEALQVAIPALEESPTIIKTESDKTGGSVREYRNIHPTRQFRVTEAKAWSIRKPQNFRVTNASSTPRLGNFVETEDTSLRLADLVADIDTKDIN